ncbi:hypothetical protein PS718_02645 [Pseudomonas fluorescens]|uniref:Uncharacterized protein n=1 Tax=Pseudomonas fluorescens TaxID=294 RepID=A0A5E7CZP0_PSEFL|nr:hypothetical protein PS718_02645 [Pseudomonas fluorescens]
MSLFLSQWRGISMNLAAEGCHQFSVESCLVLSQFVSQKQELCFRVTHFFKRREKFGNTCFQGDYTSVGHSSFRTFIPTKFYD